MAKFELKIYDAETDEPKKTLQRNKISVALYIRFQALAEKVTKNGIKSDSQMFDELEPLFLELFHALTEEEYRNGADIAEVLSTFNDVVKKATVLTPTEKN